MFISEIINDRQVSATRVLLINVFAAFAGRGINLASTLIAVPLAVHSLGVERYGLLAVILSLTSFFGYADFGLGSALVTDLAAAEANGDREAARRAVTQVWVLLWVGAIFVIAIGALAARDEILLHFLPGADRGEALRVWGLLVGFSALGLPFVIPGRIYFALQLGAAAQIWGTGSRIAVVVGSFVAAQWAPRLEVFVFVIVGLPVLLSAIMTVHIFFWSHRHLCPVWKDVDLREMPRRFQIGLQFALLHVCAFCELGLDPLLVGTFFSAGVVAQLDLTTRLYNYIPALIQMGTVPLWPAIVKARGSGNHNWATRVIAVSHAVAPVVAVSGSAILHAFLVEALGFWIGSEAHVDSRISAWAAAACVLQSVVIMQLYLLNGLGLIKYSANIALVTIAIMLPAKLLLLQYWGPAGTLAAFVFVSAFRCVLVGILLISGQVIRGNRFLKGAVHGESQV